MKPFSPVDLSDLIQKVVGYTPEQLEGHRKARFAQLTDVNV
jgi:hypothetical protein